MKANYDVTEALQRTTGVMQKELERSVLLSQLLGKFLTVSFSLIITIYLMQNHLLQLSNPRPRCTTRSISSSAVPNNL
jgi:hypothetical protein